MDENYDEMSRKSMTERETTSGTAGLGGTSEIRSSATESRSSAPSSTFGSGAKSVRETFRTGSPDDVKERVKEAVAKGVAAVAGALKGFNEQMQQNRVPEKTREAIQRAGETTREAVSSTSEQVKGMKQPLKDAGRSIGEATRDIGGTAKEEFRQTRESMKGGGGSAKMGRMESGRYESTPTGPSELERGSLGSTSLSGGGMSEVNPHIGTSAAGPSVASGGLGTEAGKPSNVLGTSLREDSMQRNEEPGVPDLRKTNLGTQRDMRESER